MHETLSLLASQASNAASSHDAGYYFVQVITAQGMWGGVLSTLTFVLIGFLVTRLGLFTKEINGKISKFVLNWALPFLCIVAFMQGADAKLGKEVGIVIAIGFCFYIVAAIISELIVKFVPNMVPKMIERKALEEFEKSDKSQAKEMYKEEALKDIKAKLLTSTMMVSYGSLQFFSYPMVIAMTGSIFTPDALALAQSFCISYMIALFSYCQMRYAGQKMTKANIKPLLKSVFSPMMCCLYASLILWAIQFASPTLYKIDVRHPYSTKFTFDPSTLVAGSALLNGDIDAINAANLGNLVVNSAIASTATPDQLSQIHAVIAKASHGSKQFWAGFREQIPALGNILKAGVGIISPLAWLVIGGTLATSNVKKAIKSPAVWGVTAIKLTLPPLVGLVLAGALTATGQISISTGTLLVLLGATPPAAATIIFSLAYNHRAMKLTSEVSALATLLCLIAMPIWVIIGYVVSGAGLAHFDAMKAAASAATTAVAA